MWKFWDFGAQGSTVGEGQEAFFQLTTMSAVFSSFSPIASRGFTALCFSRTNMVDDSTMNGISLNFVFVFVYTVIRARAVRNSLDKTVDA